MYLNNLNPHQLQAVTLINEHALILAGAGSGKTKVLTTRIAWLINQRLASPYSILAVTFTNKAAKEMQERLASMVDINVKAMFIGTFHGLCHRILRLHAKEAGLSNDFQILDMQDQLSFIKKILKEKDIDEDTLAPKTLINFINQAKERGERSHQVSMLQDKFNGKLINLYKHYEDSCQKQNLLDFAELLLRCDDLLTYNQALRQHYQERFKYILIDEFQDTNTLQYTWLKRFRGLDNIFFAVGDDDQSIYSFRGARVKNMRDFEQEFEVKHLVKLEQNYRSDGNILKCANTIIDYNSARLGKNLFTQSSEGEKVKIYSASSDSIEASWVAQYITSIIDSGTKAQDIAILYRSNAQSRVFEHTLFKQHIPYKVYGGLRFFERAEIKHAIAYLQLVDNLSQQVSMLRVINFPPRGIGAKAIEQLQDLANNLDINLVDAYPHLQGKARVNIHNFVEIIKDIQSQAMNLNLADTIEYMLAKSGLIHHYETEKEGQDRVNNLKELISAAHSFYIEEKLPHDCSSLGMLDTKELELEYLPPNVNPLRLFLSYAMLESGETQQQGVQLMTIHASKGLEFDSVFITGLEEGLFPNEGNANNQDSMEEERRLMYVAITRARKNLFLTCSQSRMLYGRISFNRSSRFLDELPVENTKWLSPKNSRSKSNDFDNSDIYNYADQAQTMPFWMQNKLKEKQDMNETNAMAQKLAIKHTKIIQHDKIFKINTNVFSTKFGEGTIVSIEGESEKALAKIRFKKHGDKILNLAMANLSVID